MYRYTDLEFGITCEFTVMGETIEEVKKKALDHIRENHLDELCLDEKSLFENALERNIRVI
jgi:predicted small metal-binding protein